MVTLRNSFGELVVGAEAASISMELTTTATVENRLDSFTVTQLSASTYEVAVANVSACATRNTAL